jgi:hypothetical protein
MTTLESQAEREDAASLTLLTIGYHTRYTRCIAPNCNNLARTILRYADRSGKPLCSLAQCNLHAREELDRHTSTAVKIHDQRES